MNTPSEQNSTKVFSSAAANVSRFFLLVVLAIFPAITKNANADDVSKTIAKSYVLNFQVQKQRVDGWLEIRAIQNAVSLDFGKLRNYLFFKLSAVVCSEKRIIPSVPINYIASKIITSSVGAGMNPNCFSGKVSKIFNFYIDNHFIVLVHSMRDCVERVIKPYVGPERFFQNFQAIFSGIGLVNGNFEQEYSEKSKNGIDTNPKPFPMLFFVPKAFIIGVLWLLGAALVFSAIGCLVYAIVNDSRRTWIFRGLVLLTGFLLFGLAHLAVDKILKLSFLK